MPGMAEREERGEGSNMRTARIKEDGEAYYHITTRVTNREHWLADEEKETFAALLRKVEGFTGTKVLTHAELDNHVHIELHVTEREELSDPDFLSRLSFLYDKPYVTRVEKQLRALRLKKQDKQAEKLKQKWTYRMHELSEFMKTLKQRYTQTYNARHSRTGTLWEGRFHSVLLEGSEAALAAVAAYIDLNAVRAGIVDDPKDYPFCGYGEAVAGSHQARQGLLAAMCSLGRPGEWEEIEKLYRELLHAFGEERGIDEHGNPLKRGISREQIEEVLNGNEEIPLEVLVRCRVSYFTNGRILGSRNFVETALKRYNHRLKVKGKPQATRLRVSSGDLCAGKTVRSPAISLSNAA